VDSPEDLELLGTDAAPGRLSELGLRFQVWRHDLIARHSHGLLVGAGALAVTVASIGGWLHAHPAPLPVPAIALSAHADSSDFGELGVVTVDLRLEVTVGDRADESVRLLRLAGPGLSSKPEVDLPPATPAGLAGELPILATVQCSDWTGLGLTAVFRVSRDARSRDVVIPLDAALLDQGEQLVSAQCTIYRSGNPLQVKGIADLALDPRLPVVHANLMLHNPTRRAVTVEAATNPDVGNALLTFRAGTGAALSIPPGGDAVVPSELVVNSCLHPEMLQALTDTEVRPLLMLDGEAADGTSRVVRMPPDLVTRVLAVVPRVCDGAPALTDLVSRASVSGTPDRLVVSVDVGVQVAAEGSWWGALATPRPDAFAGGVPSIAYGITEFAAPGRFELHTRWRPANCDLAYSFAQGSVVQITLSGPRDYPFWIPSAFEVAVPDCPEFASY